MKLTKQKLEQLIMEEYEYARAVGDEYRKINSPKYAEKIADLYQNPDTREQAKIYADQIDQIPEIKYNPDEPLKIMQPHKRNIDQIFHDNHMLHFDFLLYGGTGDDYYEEEPDRQEVYEFAKRRGLDPLETYDRIMSNYKKLMMQMFARPETPNEKMRSIHGIKAYGE